MDLFINLANVIYLLSYFVRDGLAMRLLTVLAAGCLIPYFLFRPEPLMLAILWNLFFMVLNISWVGRLLWERYSESRNHGTEVAGQEKVETATLNWNLALLGKVHRSRFAPAGGVSPGCLPGTFGAKVQPYS